MIWNNIWVMFAWWTFYWVENHLPFVYTVMHHLTFLAYWSNVYSILVPYQGPLCNSYADACFSIWKFGIITLLAWRCWFECLMNSMTFNIFVFMKHIFIPTLSVWITGLYRALCFVHYFCVFKQHEYSILHFRILTFPAQIVQCDDGPP